MARWLAIVQSTFGKGGNGGATPKVTRTDSGVTLDFTLAPDARTVADARAWRIFSVSIVLMVSSLIWFAACQMLHWFDQRWFSMLPFILGIGGLLGSVMLSSAGSNYPDCSDDLSQLAVIGNLLIRTSRDHRKRVWFTNEIRAITAEDTGSIQVLVELVSGEKAPLIERPAGEIGINANLESIVSELRHALASATPQPEAVSSSHAIQPAVDFAPNEQITR